MDSSLIEINVFWRKKIIKDSPYLFLMSPLFYLPDNESSFSNKALSSYLEALKHFVGVPFLSSVLFVFSHCRQAWNEYSMWELMRNG